MASGDHHTHTPTPSPIQPVVESEAHGGYERQPEAQAAADGLTGVLAVFPLLGSLFAILAIVGLVTLASQGATFAIVPAIILAIMGFPTSYWLIARASARQGPYRDDPPSTPTRTVEPGQKKGPNSRTWRHPHGPGCTPVGERRKYTAHHQGTGKRPAGGGHS